MGHPVEDEARAAAARFAESWSKRCALSRDRALAGELELEARPVLESLLVAMRACPSLDPTRPELSESLALASLLARRVAALGGTMGAVLRLGGLLTEAVGGGPVALVEGLQAVAAEGFVADREETLREQAARRVADAVVAFLLAPRCLWIGIAGRQDADALEPVLDDLGRRMLERDVRAVVVDVGSLRGLDREILGRVVGLHTTARMLGATAIFVGVTDAWRAVADEAGVSLEDVQLAPDPTTAARDALALCGLELRAASPLANFVRRLRR